jgi:hypothetical protein
MSNRNHFTVARPMTALCAAIAATLLLGCSTTKKLDWSARIGSYTYDDAVTELGPPDKQAALSNASTVAEWITRRSGGSGVSFGTGFYGSGVGVGVGQTTVAGQDHWLRLVFDEDGKLSSWSKN